MVAVRRSFLMRMACYPFRAESREGGQAFAVRVRSAAKGLGKTSKSRIIRDYEMNEKEVFFMKRFLMNEEGQGMVEYGLIIALVAIVVIAGLQILGGKANSLFGGISNQLKIGS